MRQRREDKIEEDRLSVRKWLKNIKIVHMELRNLRTFSSHDKEEEEDEEPAEKEGSPFSC